MVAKREFIDVCCGGLNFKQVSCFGIETPRTCTWMHLQKRRASSKMSKFSLGMLWGTLLGLQVPKPMVLLDPLKGVCVLGRAM